MENLLEKRDFTQVEKIRIERVNRIVSQLMGIGDGVYYVKILRIGFSRALLEVGSISIGGIFLNVLYSNGCKLVGIDMRLGSDCHGLQCLNLLIEY